MALNLDTAIRLTAQVQGGDKFKALADQLTGVKTSTEGARTAFQQMSGESTRMAQESAKAAGGAKAQAVALQDLQAKTRQTAAETRRAGGEMRSLGGAFQQLRGAGAGLFDAVVQSSGRAANSIREFERSLTPADAEIAKVREQMMQLAGASKFTEESVKQQTEALKRLRAQAEIGGNVYQQLTNDIKRLGNAGKELGPAMEPGIRGLKMLGKTGADVTRQQSEHFRLLRGILSQAGEGYQQLGQRIDALKTKAAGLDLSQGLNVTPGGIARGTVGAAQSILQMRRELSRSMMGRVVLTGEGLAAAGVTGAVGAGAASGLGSMAGGVQSVAGSLDAIAAKAAALPGLLKPLGSLLSEPTSAAASSVAQWATSLSAAQAKLQALVVPFEAIGTAISSIGPGAAAAAGAASLAIAGVYQVLSKQADEAQADLEQSFQGISNEAQKVLQDLVRIYDRVPAARLQAQEALRQQGLQRLGESAPDSVEARRAANTVVAAEREIAKIKGEQNSLIEAARKRQDESSAALRAQVEIARQRLDAQRKLTAEVKRTSDEERNARAIAGSIRRNQERVAAEQSRLRAAAAAAFPGISPLALPAAGQTSFQGAVDVRGFGGGARARLGAYEAAGTASAIGAAMGTGQAGSGAAQAAGRARGALAELFLTIDRVTQASNGSISSLQRQRSAWEALRNAVNPAAPAYAKATAQVEKLDQRLQQLTQTQEKAQRRGIGREIFGSAAGSLVAGGGIQGTIGAVAGGLAFSGGAAGIAAGAGIGAVAGIGALAVRVGVDAETAQVRLKALTDQFGEYNQAQASAARIAQTLRISTVEAQDGFSKLYAALRPTGVTLQEVEDAFIGFTAAARTSGATAEESSAALQQLKQALGSGVLQGDELRSIREQAPAVGQAIAREMGVTIGELKKLGEQGKITTDIVLRALARLRGEKLDQLNKQFDTSAQAIKDLQIAVEDFGRTIANTFGPGAVALLRGFTSAIKQINANMPFNPATAYGAEQTLQRGVMPTTALAESRFMYGAAELFKGTSGTGGTGLTGLRREAEDLARYRRQPVNQVLFELMQQRLQRVQTTPVPTNEAATAAAAERLAAERRAAAGSAAALSRSTTGAAGGERSIEDTIRSMRYGRDIIAAAKANGIDPALLAALVQQESGGNARAISRSGAIGLTQLMPGTARELGVNPYDPLQNLMGGARYLRQQISRFGLEGGLRAYNQGPGAQMRTPGGNSAESRAYPGAVLARYRSIVGGQGDIAEMQAQSLQQQIEAQQQSIRQGEELARQFSRQVMLLDAASEVERQRLQIGFDHEDRQRQINELIDTEQKVNLSILNDEQRRIQLRQLEAEILRDQLSTLYEIAGLDISQLERIGSRAMAMSGDPTVGYRMPGLLDPGSDQLQQYRDELAALTNPINMAKSGADQIGSAFGKAFQDIASGAQTTQEALAGMFQNIANAFLQMAGEIIAKQLAMIVFQQLLNSLGGGGGGGVFSGAGPVQMPSGGGFAQGFSLPSILPARAMGGPVAGNMPYLVGEQGPELFIPGRSGSIVPNNQLGGSTTNVVVNVDATGSRVEGDNNQAQQLGRVVSAAVQAELIKQKRPGGLLAS